MKVGTYYRGLGALNGPYDVEGNSRNEIEDKPASDVIQRDLL